MIRRAFSSFSHTHKSKYLKMLLTVRFLFPMELIGLSYKNDFRFKTNARVAFVFGNPWIDHELC